MKNSLEGEIIEQKFSGIDPQLQDAADILEVLLEDLDGFPAGQGYAYEGGIVRFDISELTKDERENIIDQTNNSESLQKVFTTSVGSVTGEDGKDVVILFLEKK